VRQIRAAMFVHTFMSSLFVNGRLGGTTDDGVTLGRSPSNGSCVGAFTIATTLGVLGADDDTDD
jgi:hypothetical protein